MLPLSMQFEAGKSTQRILLDIVSVLMLVQYVGNFETCDERFEFDKNTETKGGTMLLCLRVCNGIILVFFAGD